MHYKRVLFLFPLILSGCARSTFYSPKKLEPNVTYDDVYLIMGQSNASGVSPQSFLETSEPTLYQKYTQGNSKVLISYDCDERVETNFVPTKFGLGNTEEYFGPEIGIAEKIEQERTTYIIKATYSGSCLRTQYVDHQGNTYEFYKQFSNFIVRQLYALEEQGKNPRLRGMFWMQGESDTFLQHKDRYERAERFFADYIRYDLNKWIYDYFNFVDAYIFTRGICWVEPEIINECKQNLADTNDHWYCIKTNGEDENAIKLYLKCETGEGDDLAHYDSKSELLLGLTAGEYLLK